MIGERPLCVNCKHFDTENQTSLTCRAFPDGIPAAILENRADHRRAYQGDGGLRYEPLDPTYELPESLGKSSR